MSAKIIDLEIGALKFGQLVKMASGVGLSLFHIQRAIAAGSLYATMPHDQYRKLADAMRLLDEVEAELTKRRESYGV